MIFVFFLSLSLSLPLFSLLLRFIPGSSSKPSRLHTKSLEPPPPSDSVIRDPALGPPHFPGAERAEGRVDQHREETGVAVGGREFDGGADGDRCGRREVGRGIEIPGKRRGFGRRGGTAELGEVAEAAEALPEVSTASTR